jgi:hypothetical protein
MNEIELEEYESKGGDKMAGVAGDEREFYEGDGTLGVLAFEDDEGRNGRIRGFVLEESERNGNFYVDNTKFFEGSERGEETAQEWLTNNM